MLWHIHHVGRDGIACFASPAVDIAHWDLRGKLEHEPLWGMAGGAGNRRKSYGGGMDLNCNLAKLERQAEDFVERGVDGVKIKVGRLEVSEDIEPAKAIDRSSAGLCSHGQCDLLPHCGQGDPGCGRFLGSG